MRQLGIRRCWTVWCSRRSCRSCKAGGTRSFPNTVTDSGRTFGTSGGGEGSEVYSRRPRWVVDLDLEKFFDRVNHDKLMAVVAHRVADKRMLR